MTNKMTKAGMKRRIKALEAQRDLFCERADKNYEAYEEIKGRQGNLQKRLNETIDQLQSAQIENAELHGFINRVEIEDDRLWHRRHGAKTSTDGVSGKSRDFLMPPLRQRLRGVRYGDGTKPDIFQSGFKGRTTRTAGEDR